MSVIVVSFNTRELLLQALASIPDTGDLTIQTIVVDNGSVDGAVDAVRTHYPRARLLVNEANLGFAKAVNQGLAVAEGEFVLLLNPDARLLPGCLHTLATDLRAWPRVAVVAPRLVDGGGQPIESARPLPTPLNRVLEPLFSRKPAADPAGTVRQTGYVAGACCLIRRQAIDQIGPFDERFHLYFEETDWCLRARQRGWVVLYDARVSTVHLGGASAGRMEPIDERRTWFRQFYISETQYFRKHHGWLAAAIVVFSRLTYMVLRLANHTVRSWRDPRARLRSEGARRHISILWDTWRLLLECPGKRGAQPDLP